MKPVHPSTTHGKSYSAEYRSWGQMVQRCTNPKNMAYKYYGGRGITVCEKWLKFINFYADMGNKPNKKFTIERIDNDRGYYPENCLWSTRTEQSRNQRIRKDNKTGIKGVKLDKRYNKYYAQIKVNKKDVFLGSFDLLEDAATARRQGEEKYWQKERRV